MWFVQGRHELARWSEFVATVESEPGIIVTGQKFSRGAYKLSGLRDPLAKSFATFFDQSTIEPNSVEFNFEPYQAIDTRFILLRARKLLSPPNSIGIDIQGSTLLVTGVATSAWTKRAKDLARGLAGVESLRFDVLVID